MSMVSKYKFIENRKQDLMNNKSLVSITNNVTSKLFIFNSYKLF